MHRFCPLSIPAYEQIAVSLSTSESRRRQAKIRLIRVPAKGWCKGPQEARREGWRLAKGRIRREELLRVDRGGSGWVKWEKDGSIRIFVSRGRRGLGVES